MSPSLSSSSSSSSTSLTESFDSTDLQSSSELPERERLFIDRSSDVPALVLDPLEESDSGEYRYVHSATQFILCLHSYTKSFLFSFTLPHRKTFVMYRQKLFFSFLFLPRTFHCHSLSFLFYFLSLFLPLVCICTDAVSMLAPVAQKIM